MSEPPATLGAIYLGAHYDVWAPEGALTLRIGERSEALGRLLVACGCRQAAFITGANPRSRRADPAANAAANAALLDSIGALGLATLPGRGRDPTGAWPDELSLLVLGCDRARAQELGRRFGQSAIVHIGADLVPSLVWLHADAQLAPGD